MQRFWVQSFPDPGRRRIKWRPADRVGYETSLSHGADGADVGAVPQKQQRDTAAKKQISICLLIVTGLQYLHQHDPQILHRDLTAKNVLMDKDGTTAKISDFGQAKYRPTSVEYLTSRQPGTVLYVPPEALVESPYFTDKGDIFSFGVLMLQVTTQQLPSCGFVMREGQPEVERRRADLAKIPTNHPLRPLILQCLQDNPAKRPSCTEVWKKLGNLFRVSTFGIYAIIMKPEKRPNLRADCVFQA